MNNQIKLRKTLRVTTAAVMALTLSAIFPVASSVRGQAPLKAAGASGRGGPKEGIKVHGHWTIEVRNPDGTLATRRDFENALTPTGGDVLANILGRQKTNGKWVVILYFGDTPAAAISEPNFMSGYGISDNLVLSQVAGGLLLSGSVTLVRSATINEVKTLISTCPPNTPSCTGNLNDLVEFTSKHLAQPVNGVCPEPACAVDVVTDQVVTVKVVISFS